jgi:hypothetical protein
VGRHGELSQQPDASGQHSLAVRSQAVGSAAAAARAAAAAPRRPDDTAGSGRRLPTLAPDGGHERLGAAYLFHEELRQKKAPAILSHTSPRDYAHLADILCIYEMQCTCSRKA